MYKRRRRIPVEARTKVNRQQSCTEYVKTAAFCISCSMAHFLWHCKEHLLCSSVLVISVEEPQYTWKVLYKWPIRGQIETVFLAEMHLNFRLNRMLWEGYHGVWRQGQANGDGALLSSPRGVGKGRMCMCLSKSIQLHSCYLVSTGIIILEYIFKLMERFLKICWDLQTLKRGFQESNWLCLPSDTEAQFSEQESIKNSKEK